MSRSRRTAAICSAISVWRARLPLLYGQAASVADRTSAGRCACPTRERRRDFRAARMSVLFRAPDRERQGRAESRTGCARKSEAVGIRSINNIVDISNFVMLELGQPTHAFDADKLKGGINVRLAHEGEKFLALDGKTYSLSARRSGHRRRGTRSRHRRRHGRRRNRRDRIDAKRSAGSRLFSAGERSPDCADSESAERRQLSLRTRSRSGNDSARRRSARPN